MEQLKKSQWIISEQESILNWIEGFILDRKVQGLAEGTLKFYRVKLQQFWKFCSDQMITSIHDIDAVLIRRYLIYLEENNHNRGGCHAAYRSIRAFLRWYGREIGDAGWHNPIMNVKSPKIKQELLEPVDLDCIREILDTCGSTPAGVRDAAIILLLKDTGLRAMELLDLNVEDINPTNGNILVREGKGGKFRSAYIGRKTRIALRKYLKIRTPGIDALWTTSAGERLTYSGLRTVFRRRAGMAGIKAPTAHMFRRYFALTMLRNGVDVFSLQMLMGHADIQILRRYLKQTNQDGLNAHALGAPVDRAGI